MTRPVMALADRMLSFVVPKSDAAGCDVRYYKCCLCLPTCYWGTRACCGSQCGPCNARYLGC